MGLRRPFFVPPWRGRRGAGRALRSTAGAAGLALLGALPAAVADRGPFDLGVSARVNLLDKSWQTRARRFPRADVEFDTLRGHLAFEQGPWRAAAQYRVYYYDETGRLTHFPHHAWVGWQSESHGTLRAGIHQVPFGNLPYNSHSYFFSLAYYLGLEDDQDLGLKYTGQVGPWRMDVAWYARDEGGWGGESEDSARYSYDVVRSPDSANEEAGQPNGRVSRRFVHGAGADSALGLSLQAGRIPNRITRRALRAGGGSADSAG